MMLTLSPDVGTSTQIAPTMNARIYGPTEQGRETEEFGARHPELMTGTARYTRHIRFEITEANAMSAVGSFGKMGAYVGLPFMPVMTVYDFFVKRALDQLYYDVYWGSEFVIMGTPSGVTLSPEGAQHSWKSDIQMPNLVTWEPTYAIELDWILSDAIARQMEGRNVGRSGVLIRAVTRSLEQKELLSALRRQRRHKTGLAEDALLCPAGSNDGGVDESTVAAVDDATILAALRRDVLAGAYPLIDWRGYAGYEPGDNVVHVFTMGALATEAVAASERLLERGIFANVFVVSSPELLCGILAHADDYRHLLQGLGIDGDLHGVPGAASDSADVVTIAGRRVPIVSVHDGEAGLLDNLGSIVGVKQRALAVRRFSKCGRPSQVYGYQGIDADAVFEACGRVLAETALENFQVPRSVLEGLAGRTGERPHWRELWPSAE
ncbi:MAG: hypothetical protein R3F34_07220 [Planctomycetota bacterium]